MRTTTLRWGILSTGHIASVLTEDLRLLADVHEVAAVASRDSGRAEDYAARWGIPRAYGRYADLAADPDVDVVYVATPHHDHYRSARTMLEAGKAVLCEKPLTVSARESAELIDLARRHDALLMEAMWMRTNPVIRHAAAVVSSGELGAVRHVSAQFGFHFTGDRTHRLVNPDLAGGAILDLGVYPAHAVNLFLGEPASVQAVGSLGPTGVDVNSTALLHYPAGSERPAATATVHCSLASALAPRLDVLCERGRLCVPGFVKATRVEIVREGSDSPEEFSAELPGKGYTFQLDEVARCLRAGETQSPLVPWNATLGVARTLDAWLAGVHEAAR